MLPPTYYDPAYLNVPAAATASAGGAPTQSADPQAWKDGSFSFHDVLDALNPLQHLPIVGTLYRWITGDEPGDVARIAGDTLYGGPIGFMTGLLSVGLKEETGKDPGETVMAALTGKDDGQVTLGRATPVPAAAAAPVAASAGAAATAAASAGAAVAAASAAAPAVTAETAMPAVPVTAAAQPVTPGPAHPFLPLFRAPPAVAAAAGPTSPAEQAFLVQSAAYQRSLYGQRPAAPQNFTRPIPLQLTGTEPPVAAAMQPAGASAPVVTPAAAAPATALTLPQSPPIDIPQRMMDALDKYARMKQAEEQQQRGQQVDVAP
jgi:hypothetical protein